MLSKTFSLLFYLKKAKNQENGPSPIYLRITVDGNRKELATKRKCNDPAKWNVARSRMNGHTEGVKSLNAFLDVLQNSAFEAYKHLLQEGSEITAEAIKNKLQGIKERPRMILEIFRQHNDEIKALIGIGFAPLTHKRYETALQHTHDFIKWKFKVSDLDIARLNYEFISDLDFYLRSVRGCGHNTTIKYLSNFKKIILACVRKGWLTRNPFDGYKLATREVVREVLTKDELDRMAKKEFATERLKIARDVFLFSCYTGLAYVDVHQLRRGDISVGMDGNKWIIAQRQKTDSSFRVPLLPVALTIMQRYEEHPQCINEDRVLPVWSNQKLNEYLKEIADLCEISKRLTFHMARHTFATTITLNNGVPIETVSKLLGHKNLRITQHYAKILDFKISNDMQALSTKLAATEGTG